MTFQYGPFDAGAGANVTEGFWRKMADKWLDTGVCAGLVNEFLVYGDSTGMQVKLKTGHAWIRGHLVTSDAEAPLVIGTADGSHPRIDRVVLSADFAANTILPLVLQGAAGVSPVAPSLTQTEDVLWQVSLAQVLVGTGVSTITAGNVTDERPLIQPERGVQTKIRTTDQSSVNTVLANDTALWFWAEPNASYAVELSLFYEAPTAGDIKVGWSTPAGCSGHWMGLGLQVDASDVTTQRLPASNDLTSDMAFGGIGAATEEAAWLRAVIHTGSTAGRISLREAQNADSGTTKLHADSILTARRVG